LSKRPGVGIAATALLICGLVLFGSLLTVPLEASTDHPTIRGTTLGPPASAPFDHIVTIMDGEPGVYAMSTRGVGDLRTYMSQLADQNVLVMTWVG